MKKTMNPVMIKLPRDQRLYNHYWIHGLNLEVEMLMEGDALTFLEKVDDAF